MLYKRLLATLCTSSAIAFAPSISAETKLGWHGSGEAGFNQRTGNTVSESTVARLRLGYKLERIEYKSLLEIERKSENNDATSERYVLDLQSDLYFSEAKDNYGFINGRGEKDKFADLDSDLSMTVGLGRVLYRTEPTELKAELGLGYQEVRYIEDQPNNYEQTTGRVKLDLNHQFNETYSFAQDLLYTVGDKQYKLETNTGLRAALNSQLAISASYKYRYNSQPGEMAKKADGETNLTLIYKF